jgi:hypothetical protein
VKLDDEEPQEEAEDRGGLSFFCCLILKFVWEESTGLCTGRF